MVPGSTLMYGSSLTIAIFRPRASRIAPSDAAAMPLPNEDTTPPVTNTKRVICELRIPVAADRNAHAGLLRTGQQVSTPAIPRGAELPGMRRPAPHEARAVRTRGPRLHGLVDPAIGHGDQLLAGVDERHAGTLGERHPRFLQQALERAARAAAHRT